MESIDNMSTVNTNLKNKVRCEMLHLMLATNSFQFYVHTHNRIRHHVTIRQIGTHENISKAAIKGFAGHMRPAGRMLCRPAAGVYSYLKLYMKK